MRLSEILQEDARHVWSVTLKDQWTNEGDPEDYTPDVENWEFDIRHNGKVVGSATMDDYFGYIHCDFGARHVEIERYADGYRSDDPEAYVLSAVSNYFKSPTGQKHFEIMARQQGLKPQPIEKEELEEIKVTKTLAKKRTTPMKDMATKEKMTRKKKGKDGKIKKDAKKPMNRNVHDLANITLKGEYRS